MKGYIHSLQSLGTVDGPGVRAVVFSAGCPLRCAYCHNPDTWHFHNGELTDSKDLANKILRFLPYIKDGGVTFSGGEPCMQAEFFTELSALLKEKGLHIALDTSGAILNTEVEALLERVDLVLLDIKFTSFDEYKKYTGGTLDGAMRFLDLTREKNIPVWIRHVVVPGITDSKENILKLKALIKPYENVEKVELLPFRKLCLEKYRELGTPFPLEGVPEATEEKLAELNSL